MKSKDSISDNIDRYLDFLWEKGIIQSEKEKFRARFSEKSDYWKDRFTLFKSIYVKPIENLDIADFGCGFGGLYDMFRPREGKVIFL